MKDALCKGNKLTCGVPAPEACKATLLALERSGNLKKASNNGHGNSRSDERHAASVMPPSSNQAVFGTDMKRMIRHIGFHDKA
jgi:hypothetical protein